MTLASSSVMDLEFRPARASDGEAAVPLIYSSGPAALEFGFSHGGRRAQEFLASAFAQGDGFFGWRHHAVVLRDGVVTGIASFYGGADYDRMSNAMIVQLLRFYPLYCVPRLIRNALLRKALLPPPPHSMHYVADLGVHPAMRSQDIGRALLHHHEPAGLALGRTCFGLDVAIDNSRGQALYRKLGFVVTGNQKFRGRAGLAPAARRMSRPLRARS